MPTTLLVSLLLSQPAPPVIEDDYSRWPSEAICAAFLDIAQQRTTRLMACVYMMDQREYVTALADSRHREAVWRAVYQMRSARSAAEERRKWSEELRRLVGARAWVTSEIPSPF